MAEQNQQNIQIGYKQFQEKYDQLKDTKQPFVVFFVGDNVPGTTESWCKDSVSAHPVIQSKVIPTCAEKKIPFLEVLVGLREEWKNPDHLLRSHPDLMLTNIPTLLLYVNGDFTRKLVEGQILNKVLIEEFFELEE